MAMQSSSLPPLDVQRAPEGGEVGAVQSGWRLALREFMSNRLAVIGFAILVFFVLFCFVGPLIYHTNQLATDLSAANQPPSAQHPLGTDSSGFDELGRIMKGGQASLEIGFFAAFVAIVIGTP
jgi:peptide/nickel transport system permease protein